MNPGSYFVFKHDPNTYSSLDQILRLSSCSSLAEDSLLVQIRRFQCLPHATSFIQSGYSDEKHKHFIHFLSKQDVQESKKRIQESLSSSPTPASSSSSPSPLPPPQPLVLKRSASSLELPPPSPHLKKMTIQPLASPSMTISTPTPISSFSPTSFSSSSLFQTQDCSWFYHQIKTSFTKAHGICLELEQSPLHQTRQAMFYLHAPSRSQLFTMDHVLPAHLKHSEVSYLIETLICAFSKSVFPDSLRLQCFPIYTSSKALIQFYEDIFPKLKSAMLLSQYFHASPSPSPPPLQSYFMDLQVSRELPHLPDLQPQMNLDVSYLPLPLFKDAQEGGNEKKESPPQSQSQLQDNKLCDETAFMKDIELLVEESDTSPEIEADPKSSSFLDELDSYSSSSLSDASTSALASSSSSSSSCVSSSSSSSRGKDEMTKKHLQIHSSQYLWKQMVRLYLLSEGKKLEFKYQNEAVQKNLSLFANQRRLENPQRFQTFAQWINSKDTHTFWNEPVLQLHSDPQPRVFRHLTASVDENMWIFSPLNHFTPQQHFVAFDEQEKFSVQSQKVLFGASTCLCTAVEHCTCQPTVLRVHFSLDESGKEYANIPSSSSSYPYQHSFVEVTTPTLASTSAAPCFAPFRIYIPEVASGKKMFEGVKIPFMPQLAFEKYMFALTSFFQKSMPSSIQHYQISFKDRGIALLFTLYQECAIPSLEFRHHAFLQKFSASEWCRSFELTDNLCWQKVMEQYSWFPELLEQYFSNGKAKFHTETKSGQENTNEKIAAKNFHTNFIRMLCAFQGKKVSFLENLST